MKRLLIAGCLLLLVTPLAAQEPAKDEKNKTASERTCPRPSADEADHNAVLPHERPVDRGDAHTASLSCYRAKPESTVSAKSVEADVAASDQVKSALFPIDIAGSRLNHYYDFRANMKRLIGLEFSTDYNVLGQIASDTFSGEDEAASQVFRVLGTWLRVGEDEGAHGHLVWKFEYRGAFGSLPTPRDMGFDTGSALSTANFKELGWGQTDLYWRQYFGPRKWAFNIGHMDPGDWADQYPLLNAWTLFLNDAFYNNPTEAIPKRGFGIVGQYYADNNLYLAAGVHDANGKDGRLDWDSFWSTREWMNWVEFGYRSGRSVGARHNAHVHLWQQDAREEAGTSQSEGIAFTYSVEVESGGIGFVRVGWSDGDAPQMRRFIGLGGAFPIKGRDVLGVATSWGGPPDESLRNQVASELFYRLQVTQNLTLTPSIQVTYEPSFNEAVTWLTVAGLRMRMVF